LALSACTRGEAKQAHRMGIESLNRFARMGMELRVDAMAGEEIFGVEFFGEGSPCPFFAKSSVSLKNGSFLSLSRDSYPDRVRVTWRESDRPIWGACGGISYEGRLAGDHLVPMGERIPQDVIDSVRKHRGQLRVKFRLSQAGVYFGWDIERRPGYDPKKRDERGNVLYVPPVYFMTGGDFQEARIEYVGTRPTRGKGWYIDKKTGQKIETDF
jgi:hypothetical protein